MSASGAPVDPKGLEGSRLHDRKLDSWKEIADYLDREVRTVQRWEKTENLPVHRHEHQKKSTVYAYTSELDEWRKNRQPKDDPVADEAWVTEPEVSDNDSSSLVDNPQVEAPPVAKENGHRSLPIGRWLGVAALGASLVGLVGFAYLKMRPAAPRAAPKVRLVVIPFTNLSGDPKQDYFSAGLTDEMITCLGSLDPQRLGVIAAASSNAIAGKPIAEIGRALNVQYALEGSVRRVANRVRIDVQLIQVSDQTHIWADSYDDDLDDILSLQENVGTAVTGQIRFALDPPSANTVTAPKGPLKIDSWHAAGTLITPVLVKPEAYDAYLRGRFYW